MSVDGRRLFIGGEWTASRSGSTQPLRSPATGELLAEVPIASLAEVDAAVAAARDAQPRMAAMGVFERAELLHRVAATIIERKEAIALDLAREQGKPYRTDALVEVEIAAEMWRDAAEIIRRLEGEVLPSSDPDRRIDHDPAAEGRVRGHVAVELPSHDPDRVPVRRARGGERHRLEAGDEHATDRVPPGGLHGRRRRPSRSDQHRDRTGRRRRGSPRCPSRDRRGRRHRQPRHRRPDRAGGGRQAAAPGARRQLPGDHLRGRGPRCGHRAHGDGQLCQRGPDLRLHRAHPRARTPARPTRERARRGRITRAARAIARRHDDDGAAQQRTDREQGRSPPR